MKLPGNFRASEEEECWNRELNTSLAENGEIGCGALMRWVCIDHGQEISKVIRLGNALGKATQPAGFCMLIHSGEYLEQEDW